MKQTVIAAAVAAIVATAMCLLLVKEGVVQPPSVERAIVTGSGSGNWFCTPGYSCGRTTEGCQPNCERRTVVFCGGDFGVGCYAELSKCLAYNEELQRRPDPDVRMCIGVQ